MFKTWGWVNIRVGQAFQADGPAWCGGTGGTLCAQGAGARRTPGGWHGGGPDQVGLCEPFERGLDFTKHSESNQTA